MMRIPVPGDTIAGPDEEILALERPIGRGAFGTVFLAGSDSGHKYAVKFPDASAFSAEVRSQAFQNEIAAAKLVVHANVVQVVHVESDFQGFPPYLVMEWIAGGTLCQKLDGLVAEGTAVDLERLCRWSLELADGLRAINAEMLHRDLKPDNVLIEGDRLKIADFGLSKIVDAATRTNTFKGGQHVLYMAPEGWLLDHNTIQTDMYSLGIVLYEIATLTYPYEAPRDLGNVDALKGMHLTGIPRSFSDTRSDLPIGFQHAILRFLEKSPNRRFSDWDEARAALEAAWQGQPSGSRQASPMVERLLRRTAAFHVRQTTERLTQEREATTLSEKLRIDRFQLEQLLNTIDVAVEEFNAQSSLGKIECSWKTTTGGEASDTLVRGGAILRMVVLPMGEGLELRFFRVAPPLRLKIGEVRFAAVVRESGGGGFNLLLTRAGDEDIYGRWVACHVRLWPVQNPQQFHRGAEPFGLNQSDIREIETSDRALHVYSVKFSDWSADQLLDLASEVVERVTSQREP